MVNYYATVETRSHAFLLERRMKDEGVACEIASIPRQLMEDLCNIGVKFSEMALPMAIGVIKRSGLPGSKVYKEVVYPDYCQYFEVIM